MNNNAPPLTLLQTHGEQCRTVGAKAKVLRKIKNLSRKELSQRSGVSTATIARFENNGIATISVMLKLAEALGALHTLDSAFQIETFNSLDEFERSET